MIASHRPGGTMWSARLAFVNSTGFSATTILPLWIAALPTALGLPAWQIGLVGTLQLAVCGLANLAAPAIAGKYAPLRVARLSLAAAAVGCLGAGTALALGAFVPFALFALLIGGGFGVLLATTNRIMAGSEHAQHGYAVFQIVEVCFASSLFFAGSTLVRPFGGAPLFLALGGVCLLAMAALVRLVAMEAAPQRSAMSRAGGLSAGGILTLVAMLCFFTGQSSINSFLIPIGMRSGWGADTVAHIIVAGMIFALGGATAARIVGDRFGLFRPIAVVGALLALDFVLLTASRSPVLFAAGAMLVSSGTIFVVPYFFAALARADKDGRHASAGPAFLLGGVSLGPLLGGLLNGSGTPLLGQVAAGVLTIAVVVTRIAMRSSRPSQYTH